MNSLNELTGLEEHLRDEGTSWDYYSEGGFADPDLYPEHQPTPEEEAYDNALYALHEERAELERRIRQINLKVEALVAERYPNKEGV